MRSSESGRAPAGQIQSLSLLIPLLSLILGVFALAGLTIFRGSSEALRANVVAQFDYKTSLVRRETEAALGEMVEDLEGLARRDVTAVNLLQGDPDGAITEFLNDEVLRQASLLELVATDLEGNVVASTSEAAAFAPQGLDLLLDRFRKGLRARLEVSEGDFVVWVPIQWEYTGVQVIGALRARVRFEALLPPVQARWVGLVDGQGRTLAQRGDLVRDQAPLEYNTSLVADGRGEVCRSVSFALPPAIDATPFSVVFSESHESLFGEIAVLRSLFLWLVSSAAVLVVAVVSYSFYRQRSKTLELQRVNEMLESSQEEMRKQALRLEAASEAKSQFLANMSHEIRTPLNGVLGMNGLLLDTRLTAQQREISETVRDSAENLLTLINDILDFSKIEAGKLELEEIDFELHSVIEETCDLLVQEAERKGIELLHTVSADIPLHLRGDPGRVRQVLLNLVSNAIKFTEVGEVAVEAELESNEAQQVILRVSVRDTGIGIPQDRLSRLFHSFSQVDASMTRRYGGTGLGLSIAKQLSNLMGGTVGVESREGEGSSFWFTVRLQVIDSNEADEPSPHVVARRPWLEDVGIAVVDDNKSCRDLLVRYLEGWGARCVPIAGGDELEEVMSKPEEERGFDMLVLDDRMPDFDAKAFLNRLKKRTTGPAIDQVILMTSLERVLGLRTLLAAGIQYVSKPIRVERLFHALAVARGFEDEGDGQRGSELSQPKGERIRVLVVEDNVVNQRVTSSMLQRWGHVCEVAANGQEALEALDAREFDLVLMDCQMPEMDGFEATRRIREKEQETGAHVPIVAMTANALPGDRTACLDAGMDDYVTKPVKSARIQEVVEAWVHRSRRKAS